MSLDLGDVRLARKRAYDRVRYQLEKQNITGGELGSQYALPRIPKDLDPLLYNEWYEMFENIGTSGGRTTAESYVFGEVEIWEDIEKTVAKATNKPDISDEPWYEDYSHDTGGAGDIVEDIQDERWDDTEQEDYEEDEEPWDGSTDEGWESGDYYDYGYEDEAPNTFDKYEELTKRFDEEIENVRFFDDVENVVDNIYNSTSLSYEDIFDYLDESGYFDDIADASRYGHGSGSTSAYYAQRELALKATNKIYSSLGMPTISRTSGDFL